MKQRLAVRNIEKVLELSCQTYMRGGAGTNIARKRGKQTNGIMKYKGKQHFLYFINFKINGEDIQATSFWCALSLST